MQVESDSFKDAGALVVNSYQVKELIFFAMPTVTIQENEMFEMKHFVTFSFLSFIVEDSAKFYHPFFIKLTDRK